MKSKELQIDKINKTITELTYEKITMQKAYNYYHGYRDPEQFKHLETNYGIGTPTSITFTPLVKKHIDVLIGEYLGLEHELKISCKDKNTVSNIFREKQLKIDEALYQHIKSKVENTIISTLVDNKEIVKDPYLEQQLIDIKNNLSESFISDYEIAAQNILNYLKQSRNIDLKNKMRDMFTDLLITGTCYYRTKPSESGNNVSLEILNPIHTFIERNPNSYYLSDSRRVVIRKYMTKEEVLNNFRSELSKENVKHLDSKQHQFNNSAGANYVRVPSGTTISGNSTGSIGILGGLEVHPNIPLDGSHTGTNKSSDLIVVHEVEWLEADETTGYLTRHEAVKIGTDIYILRNKSKYVTRSQDAPSKCGLSVNGTFFLDKNGSPYSLMLATMDLQDKYDLLIFYRDNLIASSGTVGDWIDLAIIPEALGVEFGDRMQKWLAYKKSGLAMFNSAQEGSNVVNTTFNGFDDTVKAQSVQAIQLVIQSLEQQTSGITGVLPERLAQYEQRDAVSNVQLGVKMSGMLTKQYFEAMDIMYKEVNYDLLNLAKMVYPDGLTSTIVLGDKYSETFKALPEHYTITDFDIHIEDSTATYKDRENIKALSTELIKGGFSDPKLIVDVLSAKNITELKRVVDKSMRLKKEENNMVSQLQQQLQQFEQQQKEVEKQMSEKDSEIKKLQKTIEKTNAETLRLEQRKVAIEEQKAKDDVEYNNKLIDFKEKQLQVEIAQQYDSNPYNDKINTR